MLNKLLYDTLLKIFGKVEIANEGQHANVTVDSTSICGWRIEKGDDHGEQYRVQCPYCKDHSKHLYISYLSFARPVVKGTALAISPLRCKCFRRECMKNEHNRAHLNALIGNMQFAMKTNGSIDNFVIMQESDYVAEDAYKVSHEISLEGIKTWVPDFEPIGENTDPEVIEYLAQRRVSVDDVDWLHIGSGPIKSPRTGKYLNNGTPWVIFPITQNGKLAGVQARCLPKYLSEKGIKYWFHPGCRKRTVIMNMDVARQLGVGVLSEGIFDMLSVGKPGICCFGHTPSTIQLNIIRQLNKGLIWLPDTDIRPDLNTIKIAEEQCAKFNAANVFELGAHVVTLPAKDAGDMTRTEVWTEIFRQTPEAMRNYLADRILPNL